MSLTRAEVIAYLEGLGAAELGEVIDELQRRLGLPPPPPPPSVVMGTAMGMPDDPDPYEVILTGFHEARKIHLLRVVRELRPIGILDAMRLIEKPPVHFGAFDSKSEAEALARRLREVGGQVEVR